MKNALAAALILLSASALQAAPSLQGSYTLDRKRSDSIDKAIEKTITKMSFVLRPIARSRLRKTNPGFEKISLVFDGNHARVSAGPGAPVVLPMSGAPIRWKREDGEVFTVRGKLQNGTYTETFEAPDGTRTNAFSLDSQGRLVLNVTVTSPRLPAPLHYKLVYQRS